MINLRLAEYNLETGKFERFLELGKDFLFGGDFIVKASVIKFPDGIVVRNWYVNEHFIYKKDKKDPLNRFDGLFDGITYGDGRFVLISNSQQDEDMFEHDVFKDDSSRPDREIIIWEHWINCDDCTFFSIGEKLGNLHENPELWEKISK